MLYGSDRNAADEDRGGDFALARISNGSLAKGDQRSGLHSTELRTVRRRRVLPGACHRRTQRIWDRLNQLFVEERRKGVLDVSPIPSSITAHAPGYIDRENEIIVGLQTEAPLKRAIMPNGGFRLVVTRSKPMDTSPIRTWWRHSPSTGRLTTMPCSMPIPRTSGDAAARTSSPGCPTHTAAAGSLATIAASRSTG